MKGTPKEQMGRKSWMELLELGIIERVPPGEPTLWTTALHLQPKSDGTLRACGDFRPLNDRTALDGYPLPSLKHFTEAIAGAKVLQKGIKLGCLRAWVCETPIGAARAIMLCRRLDVWVRPIVGRSMDLVGSSTCDDEATSGF